MVDAKERLEQGEITALKDIEDLMEQLVAFYPAHIEKEDRHFFIPCMEYFSKQEQDDMLREFWEFDKNLIHEKYKNIVEQFEKENQTERGDETVG